MNVLVAKHFGFVVEFQLQNLCLMVDFLQDLKNVGMTHKDMSVLLNSAEDFAKMWERCLKQSDNVN